MASVLNVSAYLFTRIDDPAVVRETLRDRAGAAGLRGTILLAEEGINLFLAGAPDAVRAFVDRLRADERFAALETKDSWSDTVPFGRLLVKVKREIIRMDRPEVRPQDGRAPAVSPETLRRWLDRGSDDDGREVVLVDTRNAFEVDYGTFAGAKDWRIERFTQFPDAADSHRDELAGKTVVSFCTGGIRCEKASSYMKAMGFEKVYHLKGGILKYLEETPAEKSLWEGECFVFDQRVSVKHGLEQGSYGLCPSCRHPIGDAKRKSKKYIEGVACPNCHDKTSDDKKQRAAERHKQVKLAEKKGKRHIGEKFKPEQD